MGKLFFCIKQSVWSVVLLMCFLHAQAQQVICVTPFQKDDVCFGSVTRKILKHHNISKDSLAALIQHKIIAGIEAGIPNSTIVFADEKIFRVITDSSETDHMLTTSHEKAIIGKDGFERIAVRQSDISTFYFGRVFTDGGKLMMKDILVQSGYEYLILMSELEGKKQFKIQFEVYDKNFNKIYGDQFARSVTISKKMYFDAFLFHLDIYLQEFNNELVKQLVPDVKIPE